MIKKTYKLLENFMHSCMTDSAHDTEHIYRVLYNALIIADTEKNVEYDVLIAACLLHDIGRQEQFADPRLDHAEVGAEKAYHFLSANQFPEDFSIKVCDCIRSHRYRNNNLPQTIEAKILFDADKIDVAGAIGIARTLVYKGQVSEPLYTLLPNGIPSCGETDESPSFLQEYKYKLENLYLHFYTEKGALIAKERQNAAIEFYNSILQEITETYIDGKETLEHHLQL